MSELKFQSGYGDKEIAVATANEPLVQAAINQGLLSPEKPLVGFINIKGVEQTVASLKQAFPAHFEHHFAVKANGMSSVLKLLRTNGLRAETASPGELKQALNAGFSGREIVFDEPAKTEYAIKQVLDIGATLHIDNFEEMERVKALLANGYDGEVGYRINPQVGSGKIKAMSTAGLHSKFGVPLEDEGNRERIIQDYLAHPWMRTVHTHVGSQGCPFELIAEGINKIVALAKEVNQRAGEQRIVSIDMGGGLRVNFESEEITPTFKDYSEFLRQQVPDLFTGEFRVKTEFGRAVMAKNGVILTRVEYAKNSGGRHIATTHAGAQIAARTIFMPESWPLRLSAFNSQGQHKSQNIIQQDVAGPCCFAGDVIAHQREMPKLNSGDCVLIHDTGAYYFSNPFFYNSLPAAAVYGYQVIDGQVELQQYRAQQSLDAMMALIG